MNRETELHLNPQELSPGSIRVKPFIMYKPHVVSFENNIKGKEKNFQARA